jgi:hypothetical protein
LKGFDWNSKWLNGEHSTIEHKLRDRRFAVDHLLVETWSRREEKKLGWFLTSEAEHLADVWENRTGEINGWFYQFRRLRDWWKRQHEDEYEMRESHSENNGHKWTTEFRRVPRSKVPSEYVIYKPRLRLVDL